MLHHIEYVDVCMDVLLYYFKVFPILSWLYVVIICYVIDIKSNALYISSCILSNKGENKQTQSSPNSLVTSS